MRWLEAGQEMVWNEHVASLLEKRFESKPHQCVYEKVAELVKGKSVLDVGCGLGHFSQSLPSDIIYMGIDQSAPMIKRAMQKFPGVHLLVGNIYNIVLPKFDTIVAIDVLHHQPDLEPAFSQLLGYAKHRLIVTLWILGRDKVKEGKHLGKHGEIIYPYPPEELAKRFEGLNYTVVERVCRPWRDVYYFDI